MFKTLLLCGLLTFSSGLNSYVDKSNDNCVIGHDNSVSDLSNVRLIRNPYLSDTPYTFFGTFNFKDTFDFDYLNQHIVEDQYRFVIDADLNKFCPFYDWQSSTSLGDVKYISYIDFTYYSLIYRSLEVNIYYFTLSDNTLNQYTFTINSNNNNLSSYNDFVRYFYFSIRNASIVSYDDDVHYIFDFLFSDQPNAYHRLLNGYYSLSTTSITNAVVFNNISFNNSICAYCNIKPYVTTGSVDVFTFDIVDNTYKIKSYNYPFASDSVTQPLFYFSGSWCTTRDFSVLGSVGIFGYVPSVTQSDFKDLLYTIADTPLYFLTSLFNFEMFGVNMFVALTSLLTLVVVIVLIRKFF